MERLAFSRKETALPSTFGFTGDKSTLNNSMSLMLTFLLLLILSHSAVSWSLVSSVKERLTFSSLEMTSAKELAFTF